MAMHGSSVPRRKYAEIPALRIIYLITSVGLFLVGLGFVIGPTRWQDDPAYQVLRRIAPIIYWGWAFMLTGIIKLTALVASRGGEALRAGSTIGGTMALGWTLGLVSTTAFGHSGQWGAIPVWGTIGAIQLVLAARIRT